ncbi:GA-binding protein subunit beta-1-like [Contarinia nasturtii]|uniref:GA-binding protein subunit beta-1-like n=1 Tax=Contarinia nasturtii TaxID=265458 RepID=UPI0012D451AD|nr:GA-binding protein subunit beta-1-like [Contarinia nasturtii]
MKTLIPIVLCFGAVLINCTSGHRFKRNANENSWKAIHTAARTGDVKKVEKLLLNGIDVNILDSGERTPLFTAVEHQHIDVVKLLIIKGGDVNRKNKFGKSPLLTATLKENVDMVGLLIENGADVNIPKADNYTCLIMAAKRGSLPIVEMLLKAGAHVNIVSDDGQTALYSAASEGHKDVVRILLEYGAAVNIQEAGRWTPLHRAVERGFEEIVYMLRKNGADIHLRNNKYESAFDIAVKQGNQYMIYILLYGITTTMPPTTMPPITMPPTTMPPTTMPPITMPPTTMAPTPNTTPSCVTVVSSTPPTPQIRPVTQACRNYTNVRSMYTKLDEKEFPSMVALGYANTNQNKSVNFYCSGTIISERFVLTSAYCVSLEKPTLVRMGTESINNGKARTVNRAVKEVFKHPKYSSETKWNDIALIELAQKIPFSYFISPACLHTDVNDLPSNEPLTLTTWEAKSLDLNDGSKSLRKMKLESVPLSECNIKLTNSTNWSEQLKQPYLLNGLNAGQYCALDAHGTNETCKCDAGGLLQYFPGNTRTATVVGIASFDLQSNFKLPAVYTRIAHYLEWIESHVWPMQ